MVILNVLRTSPQIGIKLYSGWFDAPLRARRGEGGEVYRKQSAILILKLYARRYNSCRGQALIIAVLVLFAVATLAALFTGIVGSHLAQVTRYAETVELRNIAEGGLRFANEQLTYSIEGADWRPGVRQPNGSLLNIPYRSGQGQVFITVSYGPSPNQLQSRYLRIVASATFPDNPFLRHTILALKPVLLTDYTRFITDRFETNREAALGVKGVELNDLPRTGNNAYLFDIRGPVRSNTDVIWYGASQVSLQNNVPDPILAQLGLLRDDRIEISGRLRAEPNRVEGTDYLKLVINSTVRAAELFHPTQTESNDWSLGFPDWFDSQQVANTWRVLASMNYIDGSGNLVEMNRPLPRIRPPEIDAIHPDLQVNRYLALTRDSGPWRQAAPPAGFYNPGAYGWGWINFSGGIYLDNRGDIQYNHDLEKLRLNWVRSVGEHQRAQPFGDKRASTFDEPLLGPADWWDKTGRYYAPPGAEIILHGEAACPYVEIVRYDQRNIGGTDCYWQQEDGTPITPSQNYTPPTGRCALLPGETPMTIGIEAQTAGIPGQIGRFPFPPNGIIYAEGNVRVRGIMPAVRHNPRSYFDNDYSLEGGWGRSRRYDLQIVSGGTIYIEGDLLMPRAAGLSNPAVGLIDTLQKDLSYGSRLALLARDYVCVNTTALNPRPRNLFQPQTVGTNTFFYNDAQERYPGGTYPSYWQFLGADAPFNSTTRPTSPDFIELDYHNVRLASGLPTLRSSIADTRLILGHSGWYQPYAEGGSLFTGSANVQVSLEINGTARPWEQLAGNQYTFVLPAANRNQDQSDQWYLPTDEIEFLPDTYETMQLTGLTGKDVFSFNSSVTPVLDPDTMTWIVDPKYLAYLLGPIAVTPPRGASPLPVQIQAMVYAQNGSWFILPGPWFNENQGGTSTETYPGYHEPMNIRISFYGAISENMPADLGSAAEWTSKWCGPAGSTLGYLTYEYDSLLRGRWDPYQALVTQRFPKLPLTPDLLVWGERVSGEAGT